MTKVLEAVHEVGGGCRLVGAESRADKEAIEQSSTRAGWELNGSFSEYLTIGCNSYSLSILAYAQARETEDSVFELIDHERNLTSTGSSKYRPLSKLHSCSKSMVASHPRRTRMTTS